MDGGGRVPQVPGFGLDYWLCRCERFRVDTPEGRLGIVEGLRFGSRLDRPDALAVRAGLFARRLVFVPVADVADIVPREGRIVLRCTPPETGRLRGLCSRLPAARRRRGKDRRGEPTPGGEAASPLPQGPKPGLSGAARYGQPPGEAATEVAAQMLVEARALVARGWCQQDAALDSAGEPVEPGSPTACRWSIAGALTLVWENWRSAGKPAELVSRGFEKADLALAAVIGDLDPWNEAPGRTQADALAALDRALELTRRAR
jgi:hypothetical protein